MKKILTSLLTFFYILRELNFAETPPVSCNDVVSTDFISFSLAEPDATNKIPERLNYVLNCFIQEQTERLPLIFVTKFVEVNSCCRIEKVGLIFDSYETLDIPGARVLIMDLLSRLLQILNDDKKIHCDFEHHPITADDIILRIRIRRHCDFYPKLGNIAYISAMEGRVIYDTINSYTHGIDNLLTEPVSKAFRLSSSY